MSTSHDADRYANLELRMVCPNCGSDGMIAWKQLSHVLICRGCDKRYRVQAEGLIELRESQEHRIRVQVRTNSSEWRDHLAVLLEVSSWRQQLREHAITFVARGRTRWVMAAGAILLIGVGIAMAGRKPAPPPPLVIPDSLEGRAALFTESLARRDMELLIRLTDPAQHRALRIWLGHGSDLPEPVKETVTVPKAEVLNTAVTSTDGDFAAVRVRLPASGDGKEFLLDEQWVRRNEVWYFQPVRLRAVSEVSQGPARPYVKQKRRGR